MIPPIVATSNISTQCVLHFLGVILWAGILLPLSTAHRNHKLLLFTALFALVTLLIWWSAPAPVPTSSTTSSNNRDLFNIPNWQLHYLPETILVGVFLTCVLVHHCVFSLKHFISVRTKWSVVLVTGIVLPLIALNHMAGSCGGKIVTSYKKGYEVFSEIGDDLCAAHFSYLILAGCALVAGIGWHYIGETMQTTSFIVRGMENIVVVVLGIVLIVFRSVTVSTFATAKGTTEDAFFGNGGRLLDGIFWGNMMYPAVCFILTGAVGVVSVLVVVSTNDAKHVYQKCERLSVILGLMVLGTTLVGTGSATTNTFFGTVTSHHDAVLGVMQATCLLTSGLLVWLIAVLRLCALCVVDASSTSVVYYLNSICAIAATCCGGFVLSAQPAMVQMLGRDLHMDCWGVTAIVVAGAVGLHVLFKSIVVTGMPEKRVKHGSKYSNVAQGGEGDEGNEGEKKVDGDLELV